MKRVIDIVVSVLALLIFSPVMLVVAILIYFNLGRPIFFLQSRAGLHGRTFKLIKFRTMLELNENGASVLGDEYKLTSFGNLIRSWSLDELPGLINVIKGDMSLVGPRPLLIEYLPLYSEEQFRRHNVRPGITGWAQVNGRNAISWEKKFALDVWYVENKSFMLDLKIIFLTIKKVMLRDGINAEGHVTIEPFRGADNVE